MRGLLRLTFGFSLILFGIAVVTFLLLYLRFPAFDKPTRTFANVGHVKVLGCLGGDVNFGDFKYPFFRFGLYGGGQDIGCLDIGGELKRQGRLKYRVIPSLPDGVLSIFLNAPAVQSRDENHEVYLQRLLLSCEGNPHCKREDQFLIATAEQKVFDNTTTEYRYITHLLQLVNADGSEVERQSAEVYTEGDEFLEGVLIVPFLITSLSVCLVLGALAVSLLYVIVRPIVKKFRTA